MINIIQVNIDGERERALREKEEYISKFETQYIFDKYNRLQAGIKLKSYVDGSQYVGEILND